MRLKNVATELREWNYRAGKEIPDADEWLDSNDNVWELRRRGKKHDHKLRLRPDGRRLNDCYFPHIPIAANVYARTWKAFNRIKKSLGRKTTSEVWEHDILPMIENLVRKMKEVK